MKALLEALGYKIHHCTSDIGSSDNHILNVVTDLVAPGDRHLVDVGIGYPTFEPVPLDFTHESRTYRHSFLEYKFVWEGDRLVRYHCSREAQPLITGTLVVDGWRRICVIDLTPRDLSYFKKSMDMVYSDPAVSFFHRSLRAIVYPGLKAVSIRDLSLFLENNCHELEETKFEDVSELVDAVKLFPVLYSDALCAVNHLSYHNPS